MNTRTVGRILGCGAMALLLAGCFKVNMDVEVSPENTVSGSAVIAVDESILQLSGQSADQLFRDMNLSDLPAGATVGPYEEDGFIGREITFDDMPLEAFTQNNTLSGSSGGTGEELNIVRQGDEFHVTGAFNMTGSEFTGTEIPEQFLESFEFRISITFPGEVKSATGEIDGNTVTWEPMIGQSNPIEAVASATPSKSSPILMILLIAAGALVLGAIVYLLTHRKAVAPAAGPLDDGTTSPFETTPAMPATPVEPVAPVAPVEPTPNPPDAPGSAVPPEDEPPPPTTPASSP